MIRRLWVQTVWHLPIEDRLRRWMVRWLFPFIDFAVMGFGTFVTLFNIPSLVFLAQPWTSMVWGLYLAVAAAACLVCVAFPSLIAWELLFKWMLVGGFTIYFLGLFVFATFAGLEKISITPVIAIIIGLLLFRIADISAHGRETAQAITAGRQAARNMLRGDGE